MTGKPSNAREALLAELLGDVQELLARLEQADQSTRRGTDSGTGCQRADRCSNWTRCKDRANARDQQGSSTG